MSESLFSNPETDPNNQPAQQQPAAAAPAEPQVPATPAQEGVKVPETTDPNSVFANQLAGIQSDDGRQKYVDVNTALASIPHAQQHIKDLMSQNATMEAEMAKLQGANEVLQRLEPEPKAEQPQVAPGMDEASTTDLVDRVLAQREQATIAKNNQKKVVDALSAKYGEKAEAVFAAKAAELGMDVGMLTGIALQSPLAALAYFDATLPDPSNPITGGVNTSALQPAPETQPDHMRIFTGGENDLVNKWRKAKPTE